ncbi:hypothetical protein [Sphingomonas psychrolutea]|uniref:hypothetical protein n=1 Tax=Sphingomonas psychrolutea TaxID=1259676 RepID=UPI00166599C3|nr:hypothetical protein [Sphingomonas psychrolutea]
MTREEGDDRQKCERDRPDRKALAHQRFPGKPDRDGKADLPDQQRADRDTPPGNLGAIGPCQHSERQQPHRDDLQRGIGHVGHEAEREQHRLRIEEQRQCRQQRRLRRAACAAHQVIESDGTNPRQHQSGHAQHKVRRPENGTDERAPKNLREQVGRVPIGEFEVSALKQGPHRVRVGPIVGDRIFAARIDQEDRHHPQNGDEREIGGIFPEPPDQPGPHSVTIFQNVPRPHRTPPSDRASAWPLPDQNHAFAE